ncbi:MAG: hypothetical protein AB7I30_15260 [Isosphaeraceae bacterium]
MRSGFWAKPWVARAMGALIATLSLARTPLPQPDFHNVRHHDAPGEVCEHHDHLLRWHPGAGMATDVATLHWHWFLLRGDGSDAAPEGPGQALHAHAPESPATLADPTVLVVHDTSSRLDVKPTLAAAPHSALAPEAGRSTPGFGGPFLETPRAPLARGASLTVSLQRWVC